MVLVFHISCPHLERFNRYSPFLLFLFDDLYQLGDNLVRDIVSMAPSLYAVTVTRQ